jgi:hypothetical protein
MRVCTESNASRHNFLLLHCQGPNVEKDARTKEVKVWGEAAEPPRPLQEFECTLQMRRCADGDDGCYGSHLPCPSAGSRNKKRNKSTPCGCRASALGAGFQVYLLAVTSSPKEPLS